MSRWGEIVYNIRFVSLKTLNGGDMIALNNSFGEVTPSIAFSNNPNSRTHGSQYHGLHSRRTAFISYWNDSER